MVEPDGNAPSLAGCKPAVQSSTLRSLWKLAVETGATPAVSSLTRTRVCCCSSRPKNWTQGMELHQPRQAYETRQSTGSPCSFKKWCGVTVMLRAVSMSFGVTVQVASLTIYRRVLDLNKMARRVGTAPTSSGFGDPCIACLPPPYWKIFSVLPFKDTETALPLYTLSQGYTTCYRAPRP